MSKQEAKHPTAKVEGLILTTTVIWEWLQRRGGRVREGRVTERVGSERVGVREGITTGHDILLAGQPKELDLLESQLDTKYGIKRQQGPHLQYLGLQFDWRKEGTSDVLHIHQTEYEEQILHR